MRYIRQGSRSKLIAHLCALFLFGIALCMVIRPSTLANDLTAQESHSAAKR